MPYVEYDEVVASCSECGRIFRSEEDLEVHRAEVHESPATPAEHGPRPPAPPTTRPVKGATPGRHRSRRVSRS